MISLAQAVALKEETPAEIDPITLQVIRGSFETIAEEMAHVLYRMSFSSIIRESEDLGAGLFDINFNTLCESESTPMHIGSLNVLDLPPGYTGDFYEDAKKMMSERLHLAAVFTRKLALMPFDLANPVWIPDDDIDLDYHIRHLILPQPGTLAQMQKLAARLHSMDMAVRGFFRQRQQGEAPPHREALAGPG